MNLPLKAVLVAIVLHTLWGGNPVAIKLALEAFPPVLNAFFRFVIGILCIAAWARLSHVQLWPKTGEWRGLFALSVLFAVQIALLNIGIDRTTGASASVLISAHPLFAALLAHLYIRDDRLTPAKSAGLLIAFVGVGLVLTRGAGLQAAGWLVWGNWIVLASSALLGSRLVFSAKLVERIEPARLMIWQMILALPMFAAVGFGLETIVWGDIGWRPLAGLAYQGVVIAGFGFMINIILLQRYSPSVMLSFGFISPISGVALSAWILSEQLTWVVLAGMIAVGLGLVIIARQGRRRATD